ncbi:hypothetical protein D3C76_1289110 [compost metagenome]
MAGPAHSGRNLQLCQGGAGAFYHCHDHFLCAEPRGSAAKPEKSAENSGRAPDLCGVSGIADGDSYERHSHVYEPADRAE